MNALFEECERMLVTPEIQKQVDMLVDIANRIYDILEKKGMSQKDLAKMLGKTEAEVSRWLGGTHNLTIATLAKISVALGEDIITTPRCAVRTNTLLYRCSNTQTVNEVFAYEQQPVIIPLNSIAA